MATSGIRAIDDLFTGPGTHIVTGSPDRDAVSLMQDLLTGHGVPGMPPLTSASRGVFGPATTAAVREFQQRNGLTCDPADDTTRATVDADTLKALTGTPATNPIACCGYLALVLDFDFTGMLRVMSLTTQFEGAGKFGAQNRNRDRAGLSFGLIQWAQSPGRLNEILRAFRAAQPQRFVQIFGDGDANLAQALVAHTAKPRGGTDAQGHTTDPRFDLVSEPWTGRFRAAALDVELQRVQIAAAQRAFDASLAAIHAFAPNVKSERAVAFMLDVANQHGDGGVRSIFDAVNGRTLGESALLAAMEAESVRRVAKQFGEVNDNTESTRERRRVFRTTPLLSDDPFVPG